MVLIRPLALCLLCFLPGWAPAASPERTRIALERQAWSQHYAAEELACANRFAVTACVDDVRARRRAAITPLRERELRMDEAERIQRATEKQAAIAAKQAAAASRPAPSVSPQLRLRVPEPPASTAQRAPRTPGDTAARAEQAEQRVREAQERQRESQLVQQRSQRREAERRARGLKPDPLPVPAAASGAAR